MTATPQNKTVLLVSRDHDVTARRKKLFGNAGYRNLVAEDVDGAVNALQQDDIHTLVMCNTIPLEEQQRIIQALRQYRPAAKVCFLSSSTVLIAA